MDKDQILQDCIEVLKNNDQTSHTQPATNFYPHQWLWDSCFIAIGLRHFDVKRAQIEIESLFKGQWANGMIPHIIFNHGSKLEINYWMSNKSPYSPKNLATSGLTQPPMIAEAVWLIGEKLNKSERHNWFKEILPSIIRYHEWLYNERDPHKEGLVLQIHPYETGLDSTPSWVTQLREHSRPWWIDLIFKLNLDQTINYIRRDTRYSPASQRISNLDALLYWNAIRRFKRKKWDINKILHRSLFCIEDVTFNSILTRNNRRLEQISAEINYTIPNHLKDAFNRTEKAINDLWDDASNQFYCRDFISHSLIKEPTIATLITLYGNGISKDKTEITVKNLLDHRQFWTNNPVPSVPLTSNYFDSNRYWQGPTWINTNWLIIDGLKRHGYHQIANDLKQKTIELISKNGIYEYYSPINGAPLGAKDFSWSAALLIDLMMTD